MTTKTIVGNVLLPKNEVRRSIGRKASWMHDLNSGTSEVLGVTEQTRNVLVDSSSEMVRPCHLLKQRKPRKISTSKCWLFQEHELAGSYQSTLLNMVGQPTTEERELSETQKRQATLVKVLTSQIKQKIAGYRHQDMEKHLFDTDQFIDFSYTLHLLKLAVDPNKECICCFYFHEPMLLVYDYVRDPHQWTVERINNSMGHNKGNTEVACLRCNLRRRTMKQERYVMTKQMMIVERLP